MLSLVAGTGRPETSPGWLREAPAGDPLDEHRALAHVRATLFSRKPAPLRLSSRYELNGPLGAGAGGIVYRAYDTQLQRDVAIKIFADVFDPSVPGGAVRSERLLREARAIASVQHPNVIAVHDVGMVSEADFTTASSGARGVYMVMELVAGQTLRSWMAARGRGWAEIVDVAIAAGRGLAAAHRCGLIHRDFKPDNVLVGDDGRVRVLDFGLARRTLDALQCRVAAVQPIGELQPLPADARTRTGMILGTPAYMAPEQHGGRADARSDQFAFCAAFFEALWGGPAFPGESLDELLARKRSGPPSVRPLHRVPNRLRTTILRGLEPDPDRRFSSIDALVARLERIRRTRRAAPLAILGAATLASIAALSAADEAACPLQPQPDADAVHEVWRAADRDGLAGSVGEAAWTEAAPRLERFVEEARRRRNEVCAEIEAHGIDSLPLTSARASCLDLQAVRLATLLHSMSAGDPWVARDIDRLLDQLEGGANCDEPALSEHGPAMTHATLESAPQLSLLQRAHVHSHLGDLEGARELAHRALAQAPDDKFVELKARAQLCQTHLDLGQLTLAGSSCRAAYLAAERIGDTSFAAELLAMSAFISLGRGAVADARRELELARAKLQLERDAWIETRVALAEARLLLDHDDLDGADRVLVAALARADELGPAGDVRRASLVASRADVAGGRGDLLAATLELHRAAELARTGGSPQDLASILNNLGLHELLGGNYAAARAALTEALTLKMEVYGDRSPRLLTSLRNLAVVATCERDFDAAGAHLDHAFAVAAVSPDLPSIHAELETARATLLRERGQLDRALQAAQTAVAELEQRPLAPADVLGAAHLELGRIQLARGVLDQATAAFERVQLHAEAGGKRTRRLLGHAVGGLAAVAQRQGADELADLRLQRALAVFEATQGDPNDVELVRRDMGPPARKGP